MKNRFMGTALCLYLAYFVHGMGVIILSQNITYLTAQLHTDAAGIGYVISAMGIGRLIVLYFSGVLSDKFGRRPFVMLGIVVYILFFIGILFAPSVQVAFAFALLAGVANSFMDAGTYPALMESFPSAPGTATILLKAFISSGQFLLPIVMGFIITNDMYYGYSFFIPIAIMVIILLALTRMKFPDEVAKAASAQGAAAPETALPYKFIAKPKMAIEGVALTIIGFTSTITFLVVQIWMPTYGQLVGGMVKASSLQLISYYSVGSLLSVFITSYLVKGRVRPISVVVVYPLVSLITIAVIYMNPTPTVITAGAFFIGFFAAGGVLQLALTSMVELFPTKKGSITGIIYTASAIASFVGPAAAGALAKTNPANIMLFDGGVTAVGVVLAIVAYLRYNKVIEKI